MRMKNPGLAIVKPRCGIVGVFLLLASTSVSAQQPGDTVRVSGARVGVVFEADSSGLLLSSGYALYAEMRSLEVRRGTRGHAGRGFKYGFVAGGVLAAAGVVVICAAYSSEDCWSTGAALTTFGVAGLTGGVAGALIGFLVRSDIWVPVPIPGGLALRLPVGGR